MCKAEAGHGSDIISAPKPGSRVKSHESVEYFKWVGLFNNYQIAQGRMYRFKAPPAQNASKYYSGDPDHIRRFITSSLQFKDFISFVKQSQVSCRTCTRSQ